MSTETKREIPSNDGQSETLKLGTINEIPADEGSDNNLEVTNNASKIDVAVEQENTFSTTTLSNFTTSAETVPITAVTDQVTVDSNVIFYGNATQKTSWEMETVTTISTVSEYTVSREEVFLGKIEGGSNLLNAEKIDKDKEVKDRKPEMEQASSNFETETETIVHSTQCEFIEHGSNCCHYKDDIFLLESKIEILEKSTAELEEENKALKDANQDIVTKYEVSQTKQTRNYETKINQYEMEIGILQEKSKILEGEIAELEDEKKTITKSYQTKEAEYKVSTTKLKQDYETKNVQYKMEINILREKLKILERDNSNFKDEKKTLTTSYKEKISEYEALTTKLTRENDTKQEKYRIEIATLQEKIKVLEDELDELEDEMKTMKVSHQEKIVEYEVSTTKQTQNYETKVNQYQMEIGILEEKLQILKQEIVELKHEKKTITKSYQAKITEYELSTTNCNQEYETNINQYKLQINILQEKLKVLEQHYSNFEDEKKTLTNFYSEKISTFEVLTTKLTRENETQNDQHRIEMTTFEERIKFLEDETVQLEDEMKTTKVTYEEKIADYELLITKFKQDYETNIGQYKMQIDILQEKLKVFEQDNSNFEDEKKTLTNFYQEKISDYEALTTKLTKENESQNEQHRIEMATFEGKIKVLENEIVQLEDEMKTMKVSHQANTAHYELSIKKLKQDYKTNIGQYKMEIDILQEKLQVLKQNNSSFEDEKKTISNLYKEKISEYEILTSKLTKENETQNEQNRIEMATFEEKINVLEDEIIHLRDEMKTMKVSHQARIAEYEVSITKQTQSYETKINRYQMEIGILQEKLNILEKEIAELEDEKKAITNTYQAKLTEHEVSTIKLKQEFKVNIDLKEFERETLEARIRVLEEELAQIKDENKTMKDSYQEKVADYEVLIATQIQDHKTKPGQYILEKEFLEEKLKMLEKFIEKFELEKEIIGAEVDKRTGQIITSHKKQVRDYERKIIELENVVTRESKHHAKQNTPMNGRKLLAKDYELKMVKEFESQVTQAVQKDNGGLKCAADNSERLDEELKYIIRNTEPDYQRKMKIISETTGEKEELFSSSKNVLEENEEKIVEEQNKEIFKIKKDNELIDQELSIGIEKLRGKEQNKEQDVVKRKWEQQTKERDWNKLRQKRTEKEEEVTSLVSEYKKRADELRYTIEDQDKQLRSMALRYEGDKRILTFKHLEETRLLRKRIDNLEKDLNSSSSLLERRKKEWENVIHETTRKYSMLLEQNEHINQTKVLRFESEIECLKRDLRKQRESFEKRLMETKGNGMEINSHQNCSQRADIVLAEVARLRQQLKQNKRERHSHFAIEMLRNENEVKISEYQRKIYELRQENSSLTKTKIGLRADVERIQNDLQNQQISASHFALKDEMCLKVLFKEKFQKEIETIMENFAEEFRTTEKQHDQEKQKIHERYTQQIKELQNSHLLLKTTFGEGSERETLCFEVEQRGKPTM